MLGSELHAVISLLFLFCPLLNSTLPFKKRSLWSLERALSFPQLPPHHRAPEPQGSTLRLWSTAPKTLTLLTLKVPFGALCPTPVSICPPACFASYFKELKPVSVGLHECVHVKPISQPLKEKKNLESLKKLLCYPKKISVPLRVVMGCIFQTLQ